jgi:hypothetical protein
LLLLLVDPPSKDEMEQLPGLKNEIHGRPGAVKEDGLASGPGMALSIGRKAFGSAESPRDQHPQLACRFLFAARLNSFTIRGWWPEESVILSDNDGRSLGLLKPLEVVFTYLSPVEAGLSGALLLHRKLPSNL